MENSSNVDTNNQNNSFNEEKPKKKLNKKIIIISSLTTLLIVITAIYFILGSKYSKMVENSINTSLSQIKSESMSNFNYEPFSCGGLRTITCTSSSIELIDFMVKFGLKDFSFTLKPNMSSLDVSAKGIMKINTTDFGGNELGSADINFNCIDKIDLISDKSYLTHDVLCNSNIGNIKSEQKNFMYMKNNIYAEHKNMVSLLKYLSKNQDNVSNIMKSDIIITSAENKVSSPGLFDDFISLGKNLAGSKMAGEITKENVTLMYESMKDEFAYLVEKELNAPNEQEEVVKSLITALDGVILNGNNSMDIAVNLKDLSAVDKLFDTDFIPFTPEYYNITIQSK